MPLNLPPDPAGLLPLTDLAFNVLIALADDALHGYALIKELRRRTGRGTLRTGTVYAALSRLEDDGLVAQTDGPDGADGGDDERRRYYTLTPLGLAAARAEAVRLREVLSLAAAKRLVPEQG